MMKLGLMRLVVGVVMMGGVAFSQDIASMPPVVVKTVPEAGATNVPPGEVEIRVTFSKEMRDKSWSWATAWKDSTPETVEPPRYEADRKTCVVKVKLEPGKTYGFWLNSENFGNFKDKDGRSAVPYLLVFQTQKAGAAGTTGAAVVPDEMDKATVKGVASQFLAAVAAKDDKKLQSLCGDRFREWPTGAAVFAAELRQVAEKATGKPFEMNATTVAFGGEKNEFAVVHCTGAKELPGSLLIYLGKTGGRWQVWSIHNAPTNVDINKELQKFLASDAIVLPRLAEAFVDQLAAGKFEDAAKSFDETMTKAMPAEKLGKVWADLKETGGKYVGISGNVQIKLVSPFTAVYVPTMWEKKRLDVKVVFSKDRRISGLWIVNPGED